MTQLHDSLISPVFISGWIVGYTSNSSFVEHNKKYKIYFHSISICFDFVDSFIELKEKFAGWENPLNFTILVGRSSIL